MDEQIPTNGAPFQTRPQQTQPKQLTAAPEPQGTQREPQVAHSEPHAAQRRPQLTRASTRPTVRYTLPSSRRIKLHPETKQEQEDEKELAEALALLSLPGS